MDIFSGPLTFIRGGSTLESGWEEQRSAQKNEIEFDMGNAIKIDMGDTIGNI